MRVRIRHESVYKYPEPALLGPQIVRLRPADHLRARLLTYNLQVSPKAELRWQQDPWGNRIVRVTFPDGRKIEELSLTVDVALEIRPVNPFDFYIDSRCEELPFVYPDGLAGELAPFLAKPSLGPKLAAFVEAHPAKGHLIDYLVELNRSVAKTVNYIIRNEPGIQTSEETLNIGSGSCRDSAVLLVDALRAQGLAARFVSGYLVQLKDEGIIPEEPKGMSQDVVDLHAWAEVYVPGAGWIGLDGTSGLLAGEGHIPLAGTVDHFLASPVDGTSSVGASDVSFDMTIERLGHEPRPRTPYTDEQWDRVKGAGQDVDNLLKKSGLRLTMGGEPTWTSRLHPKESEWNDGALGATKWAQGLKMTKELYQRFSPGTLFMYRLGKHYPGESLPRWVLHLIWRRDGHSIWQTPELLDFSPMREVAGRAGLSDLLQASEIFINRLKVRLGLPQQDVIRAGYEDPWHFINEESNLPEDVDPMQADLDDSEDRRRLAKVLDRGLKSAVGYALPLGRSLGRWVTADWTFRRRNMFLIPGDAPMGLRLPLQSIGGQPFEYPQQDPSQVFPSLPEPVMQNIGTVDSYREEMDRRAQAALEERDRMDELSRLDTVGLGGEGYGYINPARDDALSGFVPRYGVVQSALVTQPRDGILHVFLPPLPTLHSFLELVAAVEATAKELSIAVRIEGYPPPSDPRLNQCMVTPDPGVIEVNLPVTENFDDYIDLMELVSDAANHSGLTAERYQLDGREVGSGGGHHLTLGGPSTPESPFLQHPELLARYIRYIQNHPSLSYLFASIFIGPTSQAPRPDEARHDALYELELALSKADRASEEWVPPWLSDRLFRNLLIDVTGNTHRAEISIDKLYDPNLPNGRLGILELRAFEMPPNERMAVAQMLLARGLVAMLSQRKFERPLIRWGSQLHDRFMLPHYLWSDFKDVLWDLRQAGLPFEEDLYRPFLEFKCPVIGQITINNVHLELRNAIEPWHVLGEESTMSGTARYVDSSLERVQVRVDGITDGRYVVAVNGHKLPMRPTGQAAEAVAGVRFRAWQPPHCLQPTIGIHHPLRFDIIDTWGRNSLGAATYHVIHPAGSGFNEPPLTSFEASARRAQRFTVDRHHPYPADIIDTEPHPDQPFTLDLRRYQVYPSH